MSEEKQKSVKTFSVFRPTSCSLFMTQIMNDRLASFLQIGSRLKNKNSDNILRINENELIDEDFEEFKIKQYSKKYSFADNHLAYKFKSKITKLIENKYNKNMSFMQKQMSRFEKRMQM